MTLKDKIEKVLREKLGDELDGNLSEDGRGYWDELLREAASAVIAEFKQFIRDDA